jgi:protein-L-isoaspartate(D-aspartate) O-methyltransferase
MAEQATHILAELAPGVACVAGPLAAGWSAGAPYEAVLIDGTVPEIPLLLASQAKPGTGRVLAIVGGAGRTGYAAEALPAPGGLSVRALFDAAVPVIPAFAPAPAFAF